MWMAVLRNPEGYGCDYSIGCGHLQIELDAHTLEGAIQEVRQMLFGDEAEYNPEELDGVTLYDVKQLIPLPLEKWKQEAKAKLLQEAEQEERALYEKLKAKFG